jgi:hypothetical protein
MDRGWHGGLPCIGSRWLVPEKRTRTQQNTHAQQTVSWCFALVSFFGHAPAESLIPFDLHREPAGCGNRVGPRKYGHTAEIKPMFGSLWPLSLGNAPSAALLELALIVFTRAADSKVEGEDKSLPRQ